MYNGFKNVHQCAHLTKFAINLLHFIYMIHCVFHKTAERRFKGSVYFTQWRNCVCKFSVLKENNERGLPLPLYICKVRKKIKIKICTF